MSKKILLTGAGGYIGSVVTYTFLQNGFEVLALDNFSTGFKEPLQVLKEKFPDSLEIIEKDLQDDLSSVFRKPIDAVVHFAAFCEVDQSMKEPVRYFSNNLIGSQNLLKEMLKANVKNLVFSSTCAVYGEAKYLPVDEAHPTNPTNPYGESKRMVEKLVEWYGTLLGLNYLIFRYFNVCGASDDGLIGDSKKPSVHLVQNAIRGALGIEEFKITCGVVDTPDKTPIRDYLNVLDLANAHLKAVDYLLDGGSSEVINLGTGDGDSVLEIVKKVEQITGKRLEVSQGERRHGEYAKMIAKISKAEEVLGWQPKRNLEESINSLVKWYKSYPKGWNS